MAVNKAPVIGITLDSEKAGGYAQFPWYALRENYSDAVASFGATPLLLPHEAGCVEAYIDLIDGLIITGGDFDIDPSYYGEQISSDRVIIKSRRTEFEHAITKKALNKQIPILGICGGEQLLNVIMGGSLIQHIPDSLPHALEHEQKIAKNLPSHQINVIAGSLLHKITDSLQYMVNSTHHQAVNKIAPDMVVTATAPDGVIEAIEYTGHPFCLGVQWHPEYQFIEQDKKLFQAFIKVAQHGR